jgi:sarcosine oxidase, subunit gamma
MAEPAVRIERLAGLAQVDLRLDASLASRTGYPLPTEPNTAWEEADRGALWLGPDEWLLVGPAGHGPAIVARVEAALFGTHRSVVDVSASRVVLDLRGEHRRALLSKGCALDLHPRVWTSGRCAQTMLAKAPVILHERADATRVFVRSSFATYLGDWFRAAGA